MNNDFFRQLEELGKENSVDVSVLVEKVKSALSKAVRKAYPDCENINVNISQDTKTFEISIIKDVVDDEPIDNNEINIVQARKIDPTAMVGDKISVKVDTSKFGRAAAQSAKQSIRTDLRDISKEKLLNQFSDKENECISVYVTQIEPSKGTATVLYDKTELYLFKNEQIPGEIIKEGQTIKVYITGIANREKKPVVKISRTHRGLVGRLFELNIPEIYDGTVEVKSISREAGSRTKVAVMSHDPNVDAVGACIGPKRSRISAIVEELCGEKIDIITYSDDHTEYIAKALAPAEVTSVTLADDGSKSCVVTVPASQLSLAIGNKGQNAKLAAKLTGYKIDIKSQEDDIPSDTDTPENSADNENNISD